MSWIFFAGISSHLRHDETETEAEAEEDAEGERNSSSSVACTGWLWEWVEVGEMIFAHVNPFFFKEIYCEQKHIPKWILGLKWRESTEVELYIKHISVRGPTLRWFRVIDCSKGNILGPPFWIMEYLSLSRWRCCTLIGLNCCPIIWLHFKKVGIWQGMNVYLWNVFFDYSCLCEFSLYRRIVLCGLDLSFLAIIPCVHFDIFHSKGCEKTSLQGQCVSLTTCMIWFLVFSNLLF